MRWAEVGKIAAAARGTILVTHRRRPMNSIMVLVVTLAPLHRLAAMASGVVAGGDYGHSQLTSALIAGSGASAKHKRQSRIVKAQDMVYLWLPKRHR
jgi:hypothetical protein